MSSSSRLTTSSLFLSYPVNEEENSDFIFKIILVGDVGVGKTSALQRFRYGTYSERQVNTIGVDFSYKTFKMEGKIIQLHIWDTAGQERYRTITQSYYRNAQGVIMMYDITKERSYLNVQRWLEDIKKFCGNNVIIIVIGTKLDLVNANPNLREIEDTSGQSLVTSNSNIVAFYEVSSKDGTNIDLAFTTLTKAIKDRIETSEVCECEASQVYAKNMDTVQLDKSTKRKCC